MMNDPKKSDFVKVAMRPMNKAGLGTAAESVERRTRAEGNTSQQSTHRTQCRVRVSQALERVRRVAMESKENRFTALLHHISVDLLRLSFYALKRLWMGIQIRVILGKGAVWSPTRRRSI
jgi:RNA-directed DNA polymerase